MKKCIALLCAVLLAFGTVFTPSLLAAGDISEALLEGAAASYADGYLYVGEKLTASDVAALFDGNASVSGVGRNEYAGTGAIVSVDGQTAELVVRGDLNGDGCKTASDYLLLKRAVLGLSAPEGAVGQAACVTGGSTPKPSDYLTLKKEILFPMEKQDYNGTKLAYIPLDDRPVNVDRVIYLAESGGFEVLMPDADLYSTKLDGNGTNSNGTTLGDPAALTAWLREADKECDYFVISLDQLLSGGLVGSRYLSNTDLTKEYEIIDFLVELCENNTVYVFDTVMRLASTVNYNGLQQEEYNLFRAYGAEPRATLSGSALTIENIVAGYKNGTDGSPISTSLSEEKINSYLASRERKLRLIDRLLRNGGDKLAYLFVGVDDSTPGNTIQTNEISYIRSLLGEQATLYAGTDELGMMGVARLASDLAPRQVTARTLYYGGGADKPADDYDIETLRENLEKHLGSVDVAVETTAKGDADFDILVLTRTSSAQAAVHSLVDKLQKNIDAHIPTVVIDASSGSSRVLAQKLVDEQIPLTMLLGYSSWNTVGNAIGIAVAQGVVRYDYLQFSKTVTAASDAGFIKGAAFAYLKDIAYIIEKGRYLDPWQSSAQLQAQLMSGTLGGDALLALMEGKAYICGLDEYRTGKVRSISVSNVRFPWNRTFEMTFALDPVLY